MIDEGTKLDLFRSMANHFKNNLYFMTSGKNDHLDNYHILPSPSTSPSLSPSSQLPSSSSMNINDVKITIGTSNNNKVIMSGLVSAPFYYGENQVNNHENSKISDIRT